MNGSESKRLLKVGDIAAQVGVGVQTLHYYERVGLLPEPERSASNHRLYSSSALRRVQFIKKAQAVGFTLEEIKEIFQCQQRGADRCHHVAEFGEKRLRELDAELEVLKAFRKSLAAVLLRWKKETLSRQKCAGEFCDLIENLPEITKAQSIPRPGCISSRLNQRIPVPRIEIAHSSG